MSAGTTTTHLMLVVSNPPGKSYSKTSMRLSRNCAGACELLATNVTQAVMALRRNVRLEGPRQDSEGGLTTTRP